MTKMIVITGFIIAFSAGVMSGIVWTNQGHGKPGDDRHESRESWLTDQLSLTPDQQKQMKEIWSSLGGGRRESWEKRNQIRKERDEAISNLIDSSNKDAYEKIIEASKQKQDALDAEGKKAFQIAVEKTKLILNAEQRVKYDEFLSRQPAPGRDRDRNTTKPSSH